MDSQTERLRLLEAATADPASPFCFTPVRVRALRDGWAPLRQRRYVAAVALTGHAGQAVALVGRTRQSAARLALRPHRVSFSRALSAAYGFAAELRRAEAALRRPRKGDAEGSRDFFARGVNLHHLRNLPAAQPNCLRG